MFWEGLVERDDCFYFLLQAREEYADFPSCALGAVRGMNGILLPCESRAFHSESFAQGSRVCFLRIGGSVECPNQADNIIALKNENYHGTGSHKVYKHLIIRLAFMFPVESVYGFCGELFEVPQINYMRMIVVCDTAPAQIFRKDLSEDM